MATIIKDDIQSEPTKDLFTGLMSDVKEIAAGHFTGLKGEIKDEFKNLRGMMMRIAAASGLMVLAGVLLGHTLALVLAELGLPLWAGYGIATVVLAGVGLVLVKSLPNDTTQADLVPEEQMGKLADDLRDMRQAVRP